MVTIEDYFLVGLVNVVDDSHVVGYTLPVQVSPIAIAVAPLGDTVYIAQGMSPTITIVSAEHMQPVDPVAGEEPPPGSGEFLDQLIDYRQDLLNAFVGLVGGLLQYLKDCFCHHLLVNCPECDEDDEVYLGCAEIRDDEVYKICNFARRRYVKSFPTMGYWLSLVPITPLVDWGVEYLCCMVLPELFGGFRLKETAAKRAAPKGKEMRQGMAALQQGVFQAQLRERLGMFGVAKGVGADWLGNMVGNIVRQPSHREKRAIGQREMVEQPVEEVRKRAEAAGVTVERVEKVDPSMVTENLRAVGRMPAGFASGDRIILYEVDGKVRYYARAEAPVESVKTIRKELEGQKAALAEVKVLRTSMAEVRNQLASKDQELLALRDQLRKVERETGGAPAKMEEMEAELKELRSFRDEVRRFMARSDQ
jgi:hypothetical protein